MYVGKTRKFHSGTGKLANECRKNAEALIAACRQRNFLLWKMNFDCIFCRIKINISIVIFNTVNRMITIRFILRSYK